MLHLVQKLLYAGLSERESRVYLTLLMSGELTTQALSDEINVNRTTVYHILESLTELDLITSSENEAKILYKAAPPDNIIKLLKKESESLISKISQIEDSLPELKALENADKERPKSSHYESVDGMISIAKRFEEKSEDFYELVPYDKMRKFFEKHDFDSHKQKLSNRKIKGKILIVAEEEPTEEMKRDAEKLNWQTRYIGKNDIGKLGHISVKGDEIYGFSYESLPTGIVIENESIANALKKVFSLAWKTTESKETKKSP